MAKSWRSAYCAPPWDLRHLSTSSGLARSSFLNLSLSSSRLRFLKRLAIMLKSAPVTASAR